MSNWPLRKISVEEIWSVLKVPPRQWGGIVIHHGAVAAGAGRHDIQSYANFHVRSKLDGGLDYSDLGYHFGVEEDGGIWISDAAEKARWIYQRPGGHTKATASLDGRIILPAGVNNSCVGICFAGDFNEEELSQSAFESGIRLCVTLLRGGIHEGVDVIYPHSRFQRKDCPGRKFPFDEFARTVSAELRLRAGVTSA